MSSSKHKSSSRKTSKTKNSPSPDVPPEVYNHYTKNLPFFFPTSLQWLPPSKTIRRHAKIQDEMGHLEFIRNKMNMNSRMINLLEMSIPPLLARKFHVMNVGELMQEDEQDRHYMQVASWFVMWSEAFGLQYLNDILIKQKRLDKLNDNEEVRLEDFEGTEFESEVMKFINVIDEVIYLTGSSTKDKSAPTLKENATKASEFLLEPCIIIQLPWNTVLLHQWLAAALVEVLLFEKSSLELRHWMISTQTEPCAREILFLVKQLKERIVLGFAILSQQVTTYPEVDTKHPGWILDEVVLPSLATLQFLISGKAFKILKSIKNMNWLQSETKFENFILNVYMTPDAYFIDYRLHAVYEEMYFNSLMWVNLRAPQPFPDDLGSSAFLSEIIFALNDNTTCVPASRNRLDTVKSLTPAESSVWNNVMKKQKEQGATYKERLALATATVKELLIQTGRVPVNLWLTIESSLKTTTAKTRASDKELFSEGDKRYEQFCCIYSLLYLEFYNMLIGSEKEVSIMARVWSLELEILERTQLIKLANIVSNRHLVTPKAIKLDKSATMSVESMTNAIQEVRNKQKTRNRDWLWRQSPVEWRQPVSTEEPALQLDLGTAAVVKACEDRIGRIILNAAQNCFSVYKKGGEIFPHWQTVQYILPCYFAYLKRNLEVELTECHDRDVKIQTNFCKLIHTILSFYEKSYQTWLTKIKPRQIIKIKNTKLNHKANQQLSCEILSGIDYYKETSNVLLNSHIGVVEPVSEDMFRLEFIIRGMLDWPTSFMDLPQFYEIHIFLKPWLNKTFNHLKVLYESCLLAWDYPNDKNLMAYKNLKEVYEANAIMQSVENTFAKCVLYRMPTEVIEELCIVVKDAQTSLYEWRFNLCLTLTDPESLGEDAVQPISLLVERGKRLLRDSYDLMIEFKKWQGQVQLQCMEIIPCNLPELKLAAIHYINGQFKALDQMLSFLFSSAPVTKKKKNDTEDNKIDESLIYQNFKQCRNCPKTERKWGPFVVCEQCVTDKYPDVNYFCSKACKEVWWKEEHFAEHLEFDLGLADFSHLQCADSGVPTSHNPMGCSLVRWGQRSKTDHAMTGGQEDRPSLMGVNGEEPPARGQGGQGPAYRPRRYLFQSCYFL